MLLELEEKPSCTLCMYLNFLKFVGPFHDLIMQVPKDMNGLVWLLTILMIKELIPS